MRLVLRALSRIISFFRKGIKHLLASQGSESLREARAVGAQAALWTHESLELLAQGTCAAPLPVPCCYR